MVAVLFWPRIKTRRIFRNFVGIHIFLKNMPRESFEIFVERENCSFGKEWLKFSSFPFDPTMIIFKDEGFRWRYFFTEFFQRECVWENLYFLELIRWKGNVDKDFIRWKKFRSNFLFVSKFDFRYSRKTGGNIFYDRLSVRIFLLFAIILYLGTRDFFSFFTIEEKKEAEILSRS